MKIRFWAYRVLYFFVFSFYFPYLVCKRILQKKNVFVLFKHLFPEKLNLSSEEEVIWAHAVSVGEVVAVAPVLNELFERKKRMKIVVSTVTETGLATAHKLIPYARHILMPFDFAFCMRRVLQNVRPTLVILSEGDVWPVFLHEMKSRNAFIALVSAKMSDRTFAWFQRFSGWGKWLYSAIDLFCVQDERMRSRFREISCKSEKVFVTGNTKTDTTPSFLSKEEISSLREKIGLVSSDRCIVLGSTHSSEEILIGEALAPLLAREPALKLVIVPRHPERAQKVYDELRQKFPSLNSALLSELHKEWKILTVDRLGMLTQLYQIADVAIVCGSFLKSLGGHNILEPAVFGTPTIVGPFMHAQQALFDSAFEKNAVMQVHQKDLALLVQKLLADEQERAEYSRKARLWADSLRGATKKTLETLASIRNGKRYY